MNKISKIFKLVLMLTVVFKFSQAQQISYSSNLNLSKSPNNHLNKSRNNQDVDCRIISDSIISYNNLDSTIETKISYHYYKYNSTFGSREPFQLIDLYNSTSNSPYSGEIDINLNNKTIEQINSYSSIFDINDTTFSWDNFSYFDTISNTFNATHNLILKNTKNNFFNCNVNLSSINLIDSLIEGNRKAVYVYNGNNLVTNIFNFENNDSTLKTTISYNNLKISEIITEVKNTTTSIWDSSSKYNYTYNNNDFIEQLIVNNFTNSNEIFTYTYNNDSTINRLTKTLSIANTDTSKYSFIYNNNNKNVSEIHFLLNNIIKFKMYYSYNQSGYITQIKRYNINTLGIENPSARFIYVYEEGCFPLNTTIIKKDNSLKFAVYPNPTSDEFKISCNEPSNQNMYVAIFNSQGQKLNSELFKTNSTINLKGYNNGIYFLILTDNNGNIIYKYNIVKD